MLLCQNCIQNQKVYILITVYSILGDIKMENTTKDKGEYLRQWKDYIQQIRVLQFTPDHKTGIEVSETIDKLLKLLNEVADQKFKED